MRTPDLVADKMCGKKGRRDVGSPEKDKTPKEGGPGTGTPVSDRTAGVDGRVQISRWTKSREQVTGD